MKAGHQEKRLEAGQPVRELSQIQDTVKTNLGLQKYKQRGQTQEIFRTQTRQALENEYGD